MSRYIDADAIEESILDKWGVDPKYLDDSLEASKDSYMLDWVNSAPSIDIVRCSECVHWREDKFFCTQWTCGTPAVGWCYMAKQTERSSDGD